jgi:hypothetical protein
LHVSSAGSGCETRREHLGSPESPKACEVCVKGLKLVTRACVLMMGSSSAFQGLLESWHSFPLKVMDCSDLKGNISFELVVSLVSKVLSGINSSDLQLLLKHLVISMK